MGSICNIKLFKSVFVFWKASHDPPGCPDPHFGNHCPKENADKFYTRMCITKNLILSFCHILAFQLHLSVFPGMDLNEPIMNQF